MISIYAQHLVGCQHVLTKTNSPNEESVMLGPYSPQLLGNGLDPSGCICWLAEFAFTHLSSSSGVTSIHPIPTIFINS